MAVEVTEVSKFNKGLAGAFSETDINDNAASFSLDIDSDYKQGSLSGIKGNYILDTENGWEIPRYASWVIRGLEFGVSDWNNKCFLLHAYNKTYLIHVNSGGILPSALDTFAQNNNYERVNVNYTSYTNGKDFLDLLKDTINGLTPSSSLQTISGNTRYFTCATATEVVSSNTRYYLIIKSNFLGNIPMPESPLSLSDLSGTNYSTNTISNDVITNSLLFFPNKEIYESVTNSNTISWDTTRDGKFAKGNGMLPDAQTDENPLAFKFLKPLNEEGEHHIFGITQSAKAILLKNVGTDTFSSIELGSINTSSNEFNVSAEQRNKNLYIGTGNLASTKSLWFGKIDRNQLEKTFDGSHHLLESSLETIANHYGDFSLDNLVVPTLHYGLNSSNGGIAGSANIYSDSSGNDKTTRSVSGAKIRTVNGWLKKCLENVTGTAPTDYSSFKKGMIFRLDFGEGFEATSNTLGGALESGESAYTHLKLLKSFAKGDMDKSVNDGLDTIGTEIENVDYSTHHNDTGGSDGEALHTGDLFQIVYVPTDADINDNAVTTGTDLIRLAYIGHLIGDLDEATHGDGTDDLTANAHDSERAYSGMPAYVFGHADDSSLLYRLKTTSKKDIQLKANTVSSNDSAGNPISALKSTEEYIDLAEELNISNFQISTMAECKSVDGNGGFGGGFGHEHIFNIKNRDFSASSDWGNTGGSNAWNTYNESASSGATEGTYFTDNYLELAVLSDASNTKTAYLDGSKFETGMETGKTYRVSYSIHMTAYTSGTLTVGMGVEGGTIDSDSKKEYSNDTGIDEPTTNYFDFVYDGTTDHARLIIQASTSSAFTVYFDNFSIREVQKNYHMGYGKLWVANRNEYDKLYLIDVTNWDKIDADSPRVAYQEVTLNFGRIHDRLFAYDDGDETKGLVRIPGKANYALYKNIIGDYIWDSEPTGQYIASICETYSHKPHLGDGSTNGNSVGDGRWRVWVNYNKEANTPHIRWDLFLFNFRPQGMINQYWGGSSSGNDTQDPIGVNDNYEVFMYDKTPSYQECAHILCGTKKNDNTSNMEKIYYPFEKFLFSRDTYNSDDGRIHEFTDDGSSGGWGREQMIATMPGALRTHFGDYADSQNIINFKNPSGEWMSWKTFYGSQHDWQSAVLDMGSNLGWDAKPNNNGYRQWINSRHCMKPHFKEWYHTGTTNKKTITENGAPAAHIVNLFGKLSGKYIKKGGTIVAWNSDGDVSWYSGKEGEVEIYDNDLFMFTQHDSPVAFCSLSEDDSNKSAVFNYGETQGAPNDNSSNVTVALEDGSGNQNRFNDTEAGWRTANSVPATQGYSRFNQYRYHHDHNGVKELNKDNPTGISNKRAGYVNYENGFGSIYDGGDGLGHYNNITVTWATNQEITTEKKEKWSSNNQYHFHDRIFGQGFEMYSKFDRVNNSEDSIEEETGFSGRYIDRNDEHSAGYSDANVLDMSRTCFGTGYLTYRWPHKEDPQLAGTGGNPASYGGYGSSSAGYYDASVDVGGDPVTEVDINNDETDVTNPSGTPWNNRKSVMCWATTALTDSVYKNVDYSAAQYYSDNDFEVLKSPRTAMRKITLPSDYIIDDVYNVDFVSWQKITGTQNSRRHGYILAAKTQQSPLTDSDTDSTVLFVVDPKGIDEWKKEGYAVINNLTNNRLGWKRSQTNAATSNLYPLVKQYKEDTGDYFTQIVSYTNNYITFKNLNPGLSDSPVKYDNTNYFDRTFYDDSSGTTVDTLLDTYSPIMVGATGDANQQSISVWARPQFDADVTTTNLGTIDSDNMYYPFYRYDRLWNYWSTSDNSPNNKSGYTGSFDVEAGFDMAVLTGSQTVKTHKRPMEGWGSTAGTSMEGNIGSGADSEDNTYYSSASYTDVDNIYSGVGAHTKKYKKQLLYKESEEPADQNSDGENIGVEFAAGSKVDYKISYTYDGFQEGPLSKATFDADITVDSKHIKMVLDIPSAGFLGLNPRVTHINVYRRSNLNSLFRLVDSISLDKKDNRFQQKDGAFQCKFNDEKVTVSYEGLNGISETLTDLTPRYALSCQLNDFLFVSKVNHPEIEEGSHILLRSKQGKFSTFDWSNDFLDLPMEPKAMAAFANRLFIWDETNMYVINPEEMYIEEKTEGIGILNSQSFVVTDVGLFFADRNNVYIHNGREANAIGDPILHNQSRPEWQLGYTDAIVKAEELGFTPRIVYDSIKQSIYVILQGYNDADTQPFDTSYNQYKSRIYSFNITQRRWDYYSSPNVKSLVLTGKNEVVLNDGYQIYNYRVDKRNKKAFTWESKEFDMGNLDFKKSFKRLHISGEVCLNTFNNSGVPTPSATTDEELVIDWGLSSSNENIGNYEVLDDTHDLSIAPASESDDLKVYVDGVLQTMRVQNRKPHVGNNIANDKTGSIYEIETNLPAFETASNELKDPVGNDLKNAFSIRATSIPEFLESPQSQYQKSAKQGEIEDLVHIHKGQYLLFSGTENGVEYEEYVRVRNIYFTWKQSDDGLNEIDTDAANPIKITVFRGQLGTKAIDWDSINPTMNPLKTAMPVLRFPSGAKGKRVKIVFKNQKSFIDSFSITYRKNRLR